MQKELTTEEVLETLNNIDEIPFDKITIVEENYQFEILPTGLLTNNFDDRYDCKVYGGNSYENTTLTNIFNCVQEIGIESATLELATDSNELYKSGN